MKEQINISTSQVFSANEESPLNILYNDFAESPERNNLWRKSCAKCFITNLPNVLMI